MHLGTDTGEGGGRLERMFVVVRSGVGEFFDVAGESAHHPKLTKGGG